MFHSIRWRLPLSYAGIALLTCLVLGGILITTMKNYYGQLERGFLKDNAEIVAPRIIFFLENGDEDVLQKDINRIALFSRSDVRLYDQDNRLMLSAETLAALSKLGGLEAPQFLAYLPNDERPPDPPDHDDNKQPRPLWLQETLFGYRLSSNEPTEIPRSDEKVRVALRKDDGNVLGYLELSNSPAIGGEIVKAITWMTMGSSIVAILLAAIAGWVVSRNLSRPILALTSATTSMTNGKLSTRVELNRRDELGELAYAFNSMAERIGYTIQTLRNFVADAAHELQTPITALQTNLELAETESDVFARRTYIQHAQRLSQRLQSLVNNMLDLARLESASEEIALEPLNIVRLVSKTHELFASRAEHSEIELSTGLPAENIMVCADGKQLSRAVENLLDNALKFTPPKGHIEIGVCLEDDMVDLWIADTGIGIPENDLPNLFNRFHRGRNTASYSGNGLGLVIVKTIVEHHHGTIHVQSSSSGTKFIIKLPRWMEGGHEDTNKPNFVN